MSQRIWLDRISIYLIFLVCFVSATAFAQKPAVRVGVVLDGPSSFSDEVAATFELEVSIILSDAYDVRFPAEKRLTADWTLQEVERVVDQLLADSTVDMVLTLGFISSHVVGRRPSPPKPVFAPYIGESTFQGVPREIRQRSMPPPDRGGGVLCQRRQKSELPRVWRIVSRRDWPLSRGCDFFPSGHAGVIQLG